MGLEDCRLNGLALRRVQHDLGTAMAHFVRKGELKVLALKAQVQVVQLLQRRDADTVELVQCSPAAGKIAIVERVGEDLFRVRDGVLGEYALSG